MITVRTSPSLAFIKYWGKENTEENTPATSSLAITLDALKTTTTIFFDKQDSVSIEGSELPITRFAPFFNAIRKKFKTEKSFRAESFSNFPTAAGLASSSSGFAALAYGCTKLIEPECDPATISALARIGSASASRALFPGFTQLRKGTQAAEPIPIVWPSLRVLIAIIKPAAKELSSREAMERARLSSPYYKNWVEEAEKDFTQALFALEKKDLNLLGPLIQKSYLGMFSTMLTSLPPVLYWEPDTLSILKSCATLRKKGYTLWETMDAGPQVKMFCLENEAESLLESFKSTFPHITFILSKVCEKGVEIINSCD